MTGADDHLVVFTPSGLRGSFAAGTTLLDAARRLGVDLDSVCGGRGICGRCQVTPTFGEFAKHGITVVEDHVSPRGAVEQDYRGRRPLTESRRLGCAAAVSGDLVVDVPAGARSIQVFPKGNVDLGIWRWTRFWSSAGFEVPPGPGAIGARPDRRLLDPLSRPVGPRRPHSQRQGGRKPGRRVDQRTWHGDSGYPGGHRVVGPLAGPAGPALGVAVDVGSTTIAGHLCDLATGAVLATAGTMNPQIRFGEDLMSRVSYVMMNPGGEAELTAAVRGALDDLLADLCLQGEAERDEVLEMVLVGNPIMHHLFLGLDPTPLGQAPFTLAVEDALDVPAADLNLEAHACTRVHVLPCIAGHVGADTAAVVLASRPHTADDVRLVVDVGTNAEIVLAGNGRIRALPLAPPARPSKGAQVSAGQRATPGAIERVRIDPDTGEPRFRVIGAEPWSDEPGFDEAVADTGVTGICGSGIIEVVAELWLAGLMNADGVIGGPGTRPSRRLVADGRTLSYVLHDPDGGGDDSGILVTQNDVRAIQLAKAALYAGIRLLMDHLEVDEVDQISLAGAFGSHIDTVRATVLGLVPDCEPDRVASIGNAAGAGAVIALLSAGARTEIQEVVDRIEKIETALEPSFQAHFVDAMAIPHRTADYPRLSTCITLPQRPAISTTGPERSGRRRRRAATGEE
ncbi:MAG: hypothetical protein Ct9H300mP31_06240 [Acidimicrobiaceae bacterium]|nr:MAG: hypothetical protein Ct9H300mP31_06240 [Acidimicrobiaceae bacterium]